MEQRIRVWISVAAVVGSLSAIGAAGVFWMLVHAAPALTPASPRAIIVGRWAWHLLRLIAAWL